MPRRPGFSPGFGTQRNDCWPCESSLESCKMQLSGCGAEAEAKLRAKKRELTQANTQIQQARDCFVNESEEAKQVECLKKILKPIDMSKPLMQKLYGKRKAPEKK